MKCLNYGEYSTRKKKNPGSATTYRKGCKARIYAADVKDKDKTILTIKIICSDHNHEKYTEEELLNLIKFEDFPKEIKDYSLKYVILILN